MKIIIVGGGPAGMMAALAASVNQPDVTIIEKNSSLGKKLLLTGNGRCNLTNNCKIESFHEHFHQGGKFLRDAFNQFSNIDLISFFKKRGLVFKTKDEGRIFPKSDDAGSILDVLAKEIRKRKIKVLYNTFVKKLDIDNKGCRAVILKDDGIIFADSIILATGGVSYPQSGSNGEGFRIAAAAGHKINPLLPGLVGLIVKQRYVKNLEGLTIGNVALVSRSQKKKLNSKRGNLLFTKDGISGPAVISASSSIAKALHNKEKVWLNIDFFPGLEKEKLSKMLDKILLENSKKSIVKALSTILPQRLVVTLLKAESIDPAKKISYINKEERMAIESVLKNWRLDLVKTLSLEKAMITQGGVSLKQLSPKTFESALVRGLYFAGEILDIDADTGGFNLQAAFSSGFSAGTKASL